MKKIIVINPRGIKGDEEYTHGTCQALGTIKWCNVILVSNYYYPFSNQTSYRIIKLFFHISEKMKMTGVRKIVRFFEYICNLYSTMRVIKKEQPDVVHIMWPIVYRIDLYFIKHIKNNGYRIVYTAHNVLPHSFFEKYRNIFKQIYRLVDLIIVNGKAVKAEFMNYFPNEINKVIVSRHGCKSAPLSIVTNNLQFDYLLIRYNKVLLVFGMLYYEKGIDRVVKAWLSEKHHNSTILIIAGKVRGQYKELDALRNSMTIDNDILFYNNYVEDNLLNYFINKSNVILIPYRHASMSGVLLSAASFCKTVLATDTGSISEYITDGVDGILIENTDNAVNNGLKLLINEYSNEKLSEMGYQLNINITNTCNWDNIVSEYIDRYFKE